MDTVKINSGNALMVAHRGVSGIECENTNPAFVAAGNRSYFGVETDVHVTADGIFAIFHDDNTKRLTGVDMVIEESNYADLKKLSLNSGKTDPTIVRSDYCIPQLAEYISICKYYDKVAVLELKNRMKKEEVGAILDVIAAQDYLDKTIIISFSFENLVDVRAYQPEQTVQFLISSIDDALIQKLVEHKMDLDIHYKALTAQWVEKLHANGIKVNCWTVDDPADGERLAGYGVDYITSNILE